MIEPQRITIVGGGLAGPLLTTLLANQGHTVHLIESRPDPRAEGTVGGRSINLALSARGREGLRRIGLEEAVLQRVVAMPGRMIHSRGGGTSFQLYSRIPGEAILSVSRGELNCLLLEAAEQRDGVTITFGDPCVAVDLDAATARLEHGRRVEADLLIGADGTGSVVRAAMDARSPIDAGGGLIDSTYKELRMPATQDGEWAMEPHALHIWPRGRQMMIALPNLDGSFTATCFWPSDGPQSFAALNDDDAIWQRFTELYPDAAALMPTLVEDYQQNPEGILGTIRCSRYHEGDRVVLVGDAAHAVVPFFGQGMNAAFQGCLRLVDAMAGTDDRESALEAYQRSHQRDAEVIGDLALANFIEMRERTASRRFRLKTRIQKELNRCFPRAYQPLYNLVSFTTMPYAEALDRVRRRHRRLLLAGCILVLGVIAAAVWYTGTISRT